MRLNLKWLGILTVLAILLMTPVLAATARPVLILTDYRVAPAATASTASAGPLMPGDTGTVVVTIANTLKSPGQGTQTTQTDTTNFPGGTSNGVLVNPRSSTTSTTSSDTSAGSAVLKFVGLQEAGPVKVVSQAYANPGSLGMGDSARFEFTIRADDNAAPGKYYLPLTVKTDDDSAYLNQYIPVVVDDSGVHVVINDAPRSIGTGSGNVVLDVVNYLSGGVNSVSVTPAGDGFNFKPVQEYTVGSIGAGEMYTVTFTVSGKNASNSGSPTFVVKYKNGDNWHQAAPVSLRLDASAGSTVAANDSSGLVYLLGGIALVAVIVGGLFMYLRGKRAKK